MYSRFVVLILMTTLFAGIWSQDHSRGPANRRLPEQRSAEKPIAIPKAADKDEPGAGMLHPRTESLPLVSTADPARPLVATITSNANESGPIQADAIAMPDLTRSEDGIRDSGSSLPVDLPPQITAGEYRVVEESGAVFRLVLHPEDLPVRNESGTVRDRDVYTMEVEQQRIYFIRVRTIMPHSGPAQGGALPAVAADRDVDVEASSPEDGIQAGLTQISDNPAGHVRVKDLMDRVSEDRSAAESFSVIISRETRRFMEARFSAQRTAWNNVHQAVLTFGQLLKSDRSERPAVTSGRVTIPQL